MDRPPLEDRVREGAEFLDREIPNWFTQINLADLAMREPCNCILGQIDGNFYEALPKLWEGRTFETRAELAVAHGFNLSDQEYCSGGFEQWITDMDALWSAEVTKRCDEFVATMNDRPMRPTDGAA